VGLDAYPGTVFPPVEPPIGAGYRDVAGTGKGQPVVARYLSG
jgi:hypothetical protein